MDFCEIKLGNDCHVLCNAALLGIVCKCFYVFHECDGVSVSKIVNYLVLPQIGFEFFCFGGNIMFND